ncbi:hypothetical protein CN165_33965, partial [Sinorhizobium medicae]
CGNTIVTTREAFENIRVRQRHNSLGTLLGEAIRVSSWLSRCRRKRSLSATANPMTSEDRYNHLSCKKGRSDLVENDDWSIRVDARP